MKFIKIDVERKATNQLGVVYIVPEHVAGWVPNHDNTKTFVSMTTSDPRLAQWVYPGPVEEFMKVMGAK